MAVARFCPSCGRPVDPSATYCGACGTAMPVPGTAPTYPPPGGAAAATPYSSASAPLSQGQRAAVDRRAMDRVIVASIVGLVGVIAAIVVPQALGFDFVHVTSFSSLNVVVALMVVLGIATVFSILMYWYFRLGFASLAGSGDSGLRTPATLTIFGVIGLLVVVGGAFWILGQAYQWVQCAAGASTIPTDCIARAPLLGAVGLIAVGAILYLIGFVALLLGLWRLGSRYGQSLFKIGMVLFIFPFLNIVGLILILLAARNVLARVPSSPAPPVPH